MNQSGPLPNLDTLEACIWLEYLLLGDLRQLLEEPSGHDRHKWLTALLAAFIDNLSRLSQLRNDGGDVSEVLDELPHWHREIAVFMDEAITERLRIEELHARLNMGLPHESVARAVREDLDAWMTSLAAHRRDPPPVTAALGFADDPDA